MLRRLLTALLILNVSLLPVPFGAERDSNR